MSQTDFQQFVHNVKEATGLDLSLYKEKQMKRRLTSLRNKRGYDSFHAYYKALKTDQDLYHEFLDRLTINVSEFFRNPNRWNVLSQTILPNLLQDRKRLNVWSAACSTGEEPYSLVMALADFMSLSDIQVLATDIDDQVLERAQGGIYPERALRECSDSHKKRYFEQKNGLFHVRDEIKDRVTFKKHNLLADSFRASFDLIVCRNVMIYFTEQAKNELYEKFARSLSPGGVLFVGSTEQIFNTETYNFEVVDTFFYRKKG